MSRLTTVDSVRPLAHAAAIAAIGILAMSLAGPAAAQAPAAVQKTAGPKLKGVWEPVNYTEDLALHDVFFVTPETGYVAGAAGTILKTTDSGRTWTAQIGGDPQSEESDVKQLWFVSPTVGWAVQVASLANLFRTTDGETWQRVAQLPQNYDDVAFWTESDGLYVDNRKIFRTSDGGRTWKPVFDCAAKFEVNGLPRTLPCNLTYVALASGAVAYVAGSTIGSNVAVGAEIGLVAKTTDGGDSWTVLATPYNGPASGDNSDVAFLDESTGYVRFGHASNGQLFKTTDGGATWVGMTGSPGDSMAFADPDVGWCLYYSRLSYTTDGGRRWSSREFAFPASPNAFSLPRRDRAYVVGDHGMIYRYSVITENDAVAARAIAAPAMPSLDNAVLTQIAQLESRLAKIDAAVGIAGGGAAGADSAAGAGGNGAANADAAAGNPDGAWADPGVQQQIAQLAGTVDSIASGVPQLGRKHRNLNLVVFGLKLLGDLTGQGNGLKESFSGLRQANSLDTASQALLGLHTQVDAMKASVETFRTVKKGGT